MDRIWGGWLLMPWCCVWCSTSIQNSHLPLIPYLQQEFPHGSWCPRKYLGDCGEGWQSQPEGLNVDCFYTCQIYLRMPCTLSLKAGKFLCTHDPLLSVEKQVCMAIGWISLYSSRKYLLCFYYTPGTVLETGMQQWMGVFLWLYLQRGFLW